MKYGHGRSGAKAHKRFLYCDNQFTKIYWREKPQPPQPINMKGTQLLAQGDDLALSKAKRRSSFIDFGKQDTDREILLQEIIEV